MILEGLVTTTNPDGSPHLAPMGPRFGDAAGRFLLRPFPTSKTYQNLMNHPEGVLHVTDDVLLLAKAAVGAVESFPRHQHAERVRGFILTEACRCYEFRLTGVDKSEDRVRMDAEIVHTMSLREFWGFNRAKHAVLEAAILATRLHLLPAEEVAAEYRKFRVIVDKTGGPAEREAMSFLDAYRGRSA